MSKRFLVIILIALIALPLAAIGCKGKTEKSPDAMSLETTEGAPVGGETVSTQPIEPAQNVATETIPPTAAVPQVAAKPAVVTQPLQDRNKEIQTALKAAGFYTGTIDGKIGPKTKKSVEEFQKANGLVADGKVGPKTWAALQKYLTKQ